MSKENKVTSKENENHSKMKVVICRNGVFLMKCREVGTMSFGCI